MNLVPASIGIDLGCYTSKIAVAKRGGVEVITNEANFRQTPSVVGFGNTQRQIGEAGNIKMKSNFRDTVTAPMRFLGLPADYPMLRAQTKYCPARSNISSGKLLFQVNYQGQKESLTPQQLAAAFFNKLKTIIAKNGFENKEAVISVPSYLTQQQRKAFLDAAKIAQLNVTKLINSSTAIALDYGMFRKSDLDATKPRNVLFLDFGHAKFGAFTCSFTKEEMNVLDQSYSRNLGCRDIDYHLLEFYRQIFQASSGCDISENRKAVVKLMEYIEKQRKILTGITEHQMNVQYLMQENDLAYTMTREKFQHISLPIINQIRQILKATKESLSNKKIDLHSIELVGGGSRIPFFIQLVKQIFGVEPNRTLNSSQTVARGCALMAAIKSPLFKVPDYGLHERNYYPVKFCWNFVQNNHHLGPNAEAYPEKQQKIIFDEGAKIPTSKTIKFTRKEAIQILIQYFPAVNGFNRYIGYFVTAPQHPKQQTFGVSFKLKYNQNGLITFEECYLVEQWTEQVKIPKKKAEKKQAKDEKKQGQKKQGQAQKMDVQGEQQFQIKKNKKQKHTQIKYQSNTFDANTPQDIQKFFSFESSMMNQDRIILETYEKKNELQSTIYNWKEKLNGTHKQYIQEHQIPPIIAFLQENNDWLYNEGQQANRGTYTTKIDGIKAKVGPIQKRYDNFVKIVQQLHNLMGCLKQNFDFVNSLDQKYNHITPQERQQGINLIEQTKFWMQKAQEDQSKKPKWQNPVISVNDVQNKIKQVNEACWKIMSKPAPKPEQKPKEAKPQNPAGEPPKQKMDVQNNGNGESSKPQ